jgi:hypothetical protein
LQQPVPAAPTHPACPLQVAICLPNEAGDMDVHFTGSTEHAKDELDCVAVFDGTSFRLELLSGQVKLRWAGV